MLIKRSKEKCSQLKERKTFIQFRGFTLTELLFALAILTFVLCGLLNVFVNCLFLNESSRNTTLAISHAQYIMENIKNSDFATLEAAILNENWNWYVEDITSHNLVSLPNESIITNVFQSPDPLGVSVRVEWSDRTGRNQQYRELQTLLTDYSGY